MSRLPRTPKLPLPALLSGDLHVLTQGTILWRVYRTDGRHATSWNAFRAFGPVADSRFDHHPLPSGESADRAILYAGNEIATCLAEVYQRTRLIDRGDGRPYVVAFTLGRDLRLLDTGSGWTTRAGASQAVNTGAHSSAQAWARAIYTAYGDLDGVWYPSAMWGPGRNIALHERAADGVPRHPLVHLPLDHPGLELPLRRTAAMLGYALR